MPKTGSSLPVSNTTIADRPPWPLAVGEGRNPSREGKLCVLVEPGGHQAGVGYDFHPAGFEIDKTGQLIDCPASENS